MKHNVIKAFGRNGGVATLVLRLSTRWEVPDQHHAPVAF